MELDAIVVFVKVVQSGSFTGAAKNLKMPGTTVSAKVAFLEKKLGTNLIHRTTRKLSVTQAGEIYFRKCVQALEILKAADLEVTSGQNEPTGTLRITAPVDMGRTLLPSLIQKLLIQYPALDVELLISNRVVDLVGEGVDLGIRAGELEDSTLIAKKFVPSHLQCYASPEYIKSRGSPAHPRELSLNHTILGFTPLSELYLESALNEDDTKIKIKPKGRLKADDLDTLKIFALMGEGIAFLPRFICKEELQNKKLIHLLPHWKMGSGHYSVVYPAHKFISPKIRAFLSILSQTEGHYMIK